MNENRPERKRQSNQTKQEVIGVKRVEKNAQESWKGHQNRQNATRGTRKRKRKGVEDVLFYPKNEVMAFPKIEIK